MNFDISKLQLDLTITTSTLKTSRIVCCADISSQWAGWPLGIPPSNTGELVEPPGTILCILNE